jgi:hypothetical protein
MPEGIGYGKKKNKGKDKKRSGLFSFLPDFFTPKKGSMVGRMKKGVKRYQGGSMRGGGMSR